MKGRAPQPEASLSHATTYGSWTLHPPVSALWWPWSSLPTATASAGGILMPELDWHSGAQIPASAVLGGQWEVGSSLLCFLGYHITASQGNRVIREPFSTTPIIPKPVEHRACPQMVPVVSRQPGPGPRDHCRHQLGPAEGWGQLAASWHKGIGGYGPLLWRRKEMSAQGNFIQLKIHLDRVPLPWSCPWLKKSTSKLRVSQSWLHHVTVYSSSRWFLQI